MLKECWIWLSTVKGVGPVLQKRLLQHFKTPKAVFEAAWDDLCSVEGIGKTIAKKIKEHSLRSVESILKKLEEKKIHIVTFDEVQYASVFSCKRSPILFYYLGKLPDELGIAVVGARRCTAEAKRTAEEIAVHAARCKTPIISGMAKGIDSYAHTTALRGGGYTMAIVAGGVDICYPKEHVALYEKIIQSGAIVSAYPPSTRPKPNYFVERNAYISAWSKIVVIVQAGEKSGSLTTAAFASEQGRELLAVPYSIYLKEGKGSNQLLANGVKPYLKPESIRLEQRKKHNLNQNVNRNDTIVQKVGACEKKIISYLKNHNTTTSLSELSYLLKVSENDLKETLLLMEMNGLIQWRGAGSIILAKER